MAGTAGSGGLGALAIGGIATAAVVIGGVVLMQLGVFDTEPPIEDQANTNGQIAAPVAETIVPEADVSASDVVAPVDAAKDAPVDTPSKPAEPNVVEPSVAETQIGDDTQGVTAEITEQPATTNTEVEAPETTTAATEPEVDPSNVEENTVTETAAVAVPAAEEPSQEQMEEANASATTIVSEVETTETQDAAAVTETTEVEAAPEQPAEPLVTAALTQPETAAPEIVEEPAFVLTAPELDLVRFDADGSGVIAGRAQAGVQLSVLLDDKVLDQFQVQNGGEFVSFTSIEPSVDARVVSLRAAFEGQTVMSDATFILAPSQTVAAVAEQPDQTVVETSENATEAPVEVAEPVLPPVEEVVVAANEASENPVTSDVVPVVVAQAEEPVADEPVAEETVAKEATVEEPAEDEVVDDAGVTAEVETAETDEPIDAETTTVKTANDSTSDAVQTEEKPVEVAESSPVTPQPVEQPVAEEEPEPQVSPTAVAVLKSDSEGVELVQPATPVAPELLGKVALDTISYSDQGDVQLAGRAQPASLVRVYLDNSPVADIRAAENGRWKGELSDVAPGIYTLRLDELDAEGKVLSRLETPFKRESPEVLQPPAVPEDSPAQAAPLIRAVTVQKGDTLWAISRERYGDGLLYVRVFEANKNDIRNPDLIYPGQVFSIPD